MTTKKSTRHHGYWQAQGLTELALSQFDGAKEPSKKRSAFYRLAVYYGRTLHILNTALAEANEPLAKSATHNFVTLHRAMRNMHQAEPELIPLPLPLNPADRHEFIRDMIMRALAESQQPMPLTTLIERVNHLDMLGQVSEKTVTDHLAQLMAMRQVEMADGRYQRSPRLYNELDLNAMSLHALAGSNLHGNLVEQGFVGLHNIIDQPDAFTIIFLQETGLEEEDTAHLFLEAVQLVRRSSLEETNIWQHADLLHSQFPRPYQRDAFAAFRRGDYRNLIIEAPTGSGKTLVGMMCIQDWLETLQPGQSILVLVPTSNYQQQWIGELCYHDIGLQLSPEHIFSGTITQLKNQVQKSGEHPPIIILTYTALSQLGSGKGKGGFDLESVEVLLQAANVHYIILDEVHKVVEDMHSVSTDITRLLVEWMNETLLRGLVGFSGTAKTYHKRFTQLGLSLVHTIPLDDLVAAGFVAPFAELGLPFADSTRERQIRELLESYKQLLHDYFEKLSPAQLRSWFAAVPLDDRLGIGHELLGMYHGRRDWQAALPHRFAQWEKGKPDTLSLTEAKLVSILQIAKSWSDAELAQQAGLDEAIFEELLAKVTAVREKLQGLVHLPDMARWLSTPAFGTAFDASALQIAANDAPTIKAKSETVKNGLAATIAGLYGNLSGWYFHVGEGRVETIKAIIEAEKAVRPVGGIIIFDRGRRLDWHHGTTVPGYDGVGGLFAHMLSDSRFTALAVLSNEMYLTYDATDPLTEHIADFIEQTLMRGEVSEAIFNLTIQGLDLSDERKKALRHKFEERLDLYLPRLRDVHAVRHADFSRRVLNPVRRLVRKQNLGLAGERLLARLDRSNDHLFGLVQTFFDYAILARHFRQAHVAQLNLSSSGLHNYFVVPMTDTGQRKQLMYDLTSRIVDAPSLPVNLVIVSEWARTGWNVRQPNILIDATATRNVTAWQQLRGRALRALPSWSNDCYRLLMILTGHHPEMPDEEETAVTNETAVLDKNLAQLLKKIATRSQWQTIQQSGIDGLSAKQRNDLATKLMRTENKVTHIYELVKAYGSSSQVTYNRAEKVWRRRQAIAAKHSHETSVNPFNGRRQSGEDHAPLIYMSDPRTDLPPVLQVHLIKKLAGCDETIVVGWLEK